MLTGFWRPVVGAASLLVVGCGEVGRLAEELVDRRPPREKYLAGLTAAGLSETALVRDWVAAGALALRHAPVVTAPHEEQVALPRGEPIAVGLKVALKRGQLARVEVDFPADTATRFFVDVWWMDSAGTSLEERLTDMGTGQRAIEWEPRADGWHVIRIQPELLRGGRLGVRLTVAPTLAFPVSGRGERDILSQWGAPRDGGRRSHQGIDIFAPRGTPVIAGRGGRVVEVGENELGGLVVWLVDDLGNRHYYAHLSAQLVNDGDVVRAGDTLGLVGNTGNARTTPPHLHFGVYRRGHGALDPYWFVHRPPGAMARLVADTTALGNHARARVADAMIRRGPRAGADTLGRLGPADSVRVVAATGGWYRVVLGDGSQGYMWGRSLSVVAAPAPESPAPITFAAP